MFTVDNTVIDLQSGEEAVKMLFEELGEDFLNRYKKIRNLVMGKRIGYDYLLSRKVTCSHPAFMEKHPNMDSDTFCLLTTDLLIRGEAISFILKKQTGIDVIKRYNEIKKSIYQRELKRKRLYNKMKISDLNVSSDDRKRSVFAPLRFLPFAKKNFTKILMFFMRGIKYSYKMIFRRYY